MNLYTGATKFEEVIYIVYRTTNLLNNEFYIGKHETRDINDGYTGSGIRIKASVKKYGKRNFKVEILHIFDNKNESLKWETLEVDKYLEKDPLCLNLVRGGAGPRNPHGLERAWEHCEALSRANKGRVKSQEERNNISIGGTGRSMPECPAERCLKISQAKKGKALSQEHRSALSQAKKGKALSQEHRSALSLAGKGHEVSQETRDKISNSVKESHARRKAKKLEEELNATILK